MILAAALLLDALIGEPRWLWSRLPHPAILMGSVVAWLDATLNRGKGRRIRGVFAVLVLLAVALIASYLIALIPLGLLPELITAAILLAQRSLVDHVRAVAQCLRLSPRAGRRAVARIVSRDTVQMDDSAIARSAIESAAENLSDGVIAPAFWFALAGLPGLLIYKFVNTADSMIGYRTPRHERFGWAAARLDDLLNWIPARITAFLITGVTSLPAQFTDIRRDAALHKSPNAGWPEAAMAQRLNIALAGPRSYDGALRNFPYVNANARQTLGPGDIDAAIKVLWRVWAKALLLFVCLAVILS